MTATAETGFRSEITDGVLRLTFDRPKRMNAIDLPTMTAFAAAVHDGGADPAVRTIVITGSGRAFCTGADVKAIPGDGKVINERSYLSTYDQWEAPQEGTPPFRRMAKPVLAAVNGLCCGAGGGTWC